MKLNKYILTLFTFILFTISAYAQSVSKLWREGSEAENKGDYVKAEKIYASLASWQYNDYNSHVALARVYFYNKKYDNCISTCEEAYKIGLYTAETTTFTPYKDMAYRVDLWSTWINCLLQQQKFDEAISKSNRFIEGSPNNVSGFVWLGISLYHKGDYDNSLITFNKVVSMGNFNGQYWKGICYLKQNKTIEAEDAFKKAISGYPKDPNSYISLGKLFRDQFEYKKSLEAYSSGTKEMPDNTSLIYLAAWANFANGNYPEAIALTNKYIEKTSYGSVDLMLDIKMEGSSAYAYIGNIKESNPIKLAGFKQGDKLIAVNKNSIYNKNSSVGELKEYIINELKGEIGSTFDLKVEQDKKIYKNTVKREITYTEESVRGFSARSAYYTYNKEFDKAAADINTANSIKTTSDVDLAEGVLALNKGNYSKVVLKIKDFDQNSYANIYLAIAFAKANDMNSSIKHFKLIPEGDLTKNHVPLYKEKMTLMEIYNPLIKEYTDKANKMVSTGQYKDALVELSKASNMQEGDDKKKTLKKMFDIVGMNPASGELSEEARKYALRSEMLVKETDFNGAESELLKAIQIAPYDSKLYFNMAIINAELKHYQEAINYMKIYVDGVPDAPNNRQAKDEIIKWEFLLERGK